MPSRLNNRKYQGWWTCGRCGREYPAGEMQWQNLIGSLRCRKCYDDPGFVLVSQRFDKIAKVLAKVPRFGEPELEPKLAQPTGINNGY